LSLGRLLFSYLFILTRCGTAHAEALPEKFFEDVRNMLTKRRAVPIADDLDIGTSSLSSTSDEEISGSDVSFDISSALTQRNPSLQKGKAPLLAHDDGTDDDTELEELIRNSISRRNIKDGTELLKNTKGKKKLSKGELGGGSFQSMGDSSFTISVARPHPIILC
jgi:hypothetical protein